MTPEEAIADALTALVAPDGLVPAPETTKQFVDHLKSMGFEVYDRICSDDTIVRSDREQVLAYWLERGILGQEDTNYTQYLETGVIPGGQETADRLARYFARYRVRVSAGR